MIGKADCGKPCYAYKENLFHNCPECNKIVKEKIENGTYKKQVLDKEIGQYKWEEYYNEENICLNFNFNEKVDGCDVDFKKMCEFFEKEETRRKKYIGLVLIMKKRMSKKICLFII